MTDRTCGGVDGTLKCAWWTCTVERVKPQTQGVCHCNPKAENKDADDFCRHHATTRGWTDELRFHAVTTIEEEATEDERMAAYSQRGAEMDIERLEAEITRLTARCQEVLEKCQAQTKKSNISSYLSFPDEIKTILEASDDA